MQSPTNGKTIHILPPQEADQVKRTSVCADCFDELTVAYDWRQRQSTVTCITPDCPCHGFVTRSYVDRAKAENRAQAIEAEQVLKNAAPWLQKPKRSAEEILKELGL